MANEYRELVHLSRLGRDLQNSTGTIATHADCYGIRDAAPSVPVSVMPDTTLATPVNRASFVIVALRSRWHLNRIE